MLSIRANTPCKYNLERSAGRSGSAPSRPCACRPPALQNVVGDSLHRTQTQCLKVQALVHREARRSKEQVRQRRDKPTSPPGRSECISPRRWSIAAVERKRTCALWDQAPAFNNDDVPVGLGGGQQRGQTAALSCHLIPNKLETTRLPSARSASTFGHHSTFAQAVRFLPSSHLPAHASLAALLSRYQQCPYLQAISSPCAMRAVRQIKHY